MTDILEQRHEPVEYKHNDKNVFIIRICCDNPTNKNRSEGYYIKTYRIKGVNEERYPLQPNLEYDFQANINQATTHDDINGVGTYDKKQIEDIKKMIADKLDAESKG